RVTIGCVRRIELVRTADPLDAWIAIDCVTDGKRIVTRYAETVLDALISNSLDDVINYRCRFHKSCSSSFLSQAFEDPHFREFQISCADRSSPLLFLSRDFVAGGS